MTNPTGTKFYSYKSNLKIKHDKHAIICFYLLNIVLQFESLKNQFPFVALS